MLPPARQPQSNQTTQATTLRATARRFASYGSPQVLAVCLFLAILVRLSAGLVLGWHITDVLAVICVAGLIPFVEWNVHKVVLHSKPRQFGSLRIDLGEGHRGHHRHPNELGRALLRTSDAALFLALNVGIACGVAFIVSTSIGGPRVGPMLSAAVAASVGLLHYEWSHYLFHSTYQPRTRYYARLKRNHRLHHWRNENYWLGITSNFSDRVLQTLPTNKSAVPMSPTTRTLGIDPDTSANG